MGKKSQFDFNGTDFQRLTAQPSPTLTVLCVQLFGHSALVYSSLQRSFSKVSNFSAAGACADKLAGKKRILLDIPAAQSMLGNFLSGVQLSQLYTPNLLMKNSVVTPCSKKKSFSWFSAWFHSAALCLHMRPVSNSENTSLSAQLSTGVKRGLAKGGHMTLPSGAPRILHNHVRT